MDNEMIERCKTELDEKFGHWTDEMLNGIVLTVIKAMREPTEEMCKIGAMFLPDYDPTVDDSRKCWQDMIDAIINE